MAMKKKRTKQTVQYRLITRACCRCATKLDRKYYMDLIPDSFSVGCCQYCFANTNLNEYEYEPRMDYSSHRPRSGGGERARAGR